MANVTQKDIAKALHISRETVTKALSGDPKVSAKTIEKVTNAATEMGYVPNFIARNLVSKSSKTIGLIIPKISHSFFSTIVEFMYQYITEQGYNVIPMISFENKNNEIANIQTLLSMRIDGIIASVSQDTIDDDIYVELSRRGIPFVFFDRVIENSHFSRIVTNDRVASCDIVCYALSKGYKRPAHLAGYTNINIGRERRNGFMDALNKYGITINPDWIIEGGFSSELRYENAKKLLKDKDRPDLIFCFNDSIAESVYDAATNLDIKIPDELGVIGFGNLKLSSMLRPALTTIEMPLETIAKESVGLLMNKINNRKGNDIVMLKSKMIIRDSCR